MNKPINNRRTFIRAGLALPALATFGRFAAASTDLPEPTIECTPDGPKTPRQTAGPFYTPDTPLKNDFRADDPGGQPFQLVGFVKSRDCRALSNATIELWHADSKGVYDNRGYRMRGHQITDEKGRFHFLTTHPGRYPGRTPHFHVTVITATNRKLTTQLYFPGEAQNRRDGIFDERLLIQSTEVDGIQTGLFEFVL